MGLDESMCNEIIGRIADTPSLIQVISLFSSFHIEIHIPSKYVYDRSIDDIKYISRK